MLKTLIVLFAAMLTALLSGCSTTYSLKYDARLRHAPEPGTLRVEEDGLVFSFLLTPAGILFSIENNSGNDAELDWSRSYFIEPGGNSFKALNLDTIREDKMVAAKSRDAVVIPRGAKLLRFTTASTNPERYTVVHSAQIATWMSHTSQAWTFASTSIQEGFDFPRYFPLDFKAEGSRLAAKLEEVSTLLKAGSSMGLGLMIRKDGSEKLQRFDIDVEKVSVLAKRTLHEGETVSTVQVATHECTRAGGWAWKSLTSSSGSGTMESGPRSQP
jgi:hypothetical protein